MAESRSKATVACEVSFSAAVCEQTMLNADLTPASANPTAGAVTQVKTSGQRSCFCTVLQAICLCLCPDDSLEEVSYLPSHSVRTYGRKTLVLDLDETLVCCSLQPQFKPDLILPVAMQDKDAFISLKKRPGLDLFLKTVSALFELVVFTASRARYAETVIAAIDPKGRINHTLFREHCQRVETGFVKDLSKLGRNLNEVIIIDVTSTQNSPIAYSLQPQNSLAVSSFFGEEGDKELTGLLPVLRALSQAEDIFPLLQAYRDAKAHTYVRADTPSRSTTKADLGL